MRRGVMDSPKPRLSTLMTQASIRVDNPIISQVENDAISDNIRSP
jgi:hypothetical protein